MPGKELASIAEGSENSTAFFWVGTVVNMLSLEESADESRGAKSQSPPWLTSQWPVRPDGREMKMTFPVSFDMSTVLPQSRVEYHLKSLISRAAIPCCFCLSQGRLPLRKRQCPQIKSNHGVSGWKVLWLKNFFGSRRDLNVRKKRRQEKKMQLDCLDLLRWNGTKLLYWADLAIHLSCQDWDPIKLLWACCESMNAIPIQYMRQLCCYSVACVCLCVAVSTESSSPDAATEITCAPHIKNTGSYRWPMRTL